MTWTLEWSPVAVRDLLELPFGLAQRIDAAVIALAEGRPGEGAVERMSRTDPHRLRVRLRGASALLWAEPETRVLHVARIFPNP